LAEERRSKTYKSISQIIASQKLARVPSETKPCILPHVTSLRFYERKTMNVKVKKSTVTFQASTGESSKHTGPRR